MLTLPDFKEKKIIVVFPKDGDKILFSNDNLVIKDREEKIKYQYTCYRIFMLIIVGGFTLTTGLIERAKKFNFAIVFMTYSFKVYETINNQMEGNTLLREKQYRNTREDEISKKIIINKLNNQKQMLLKIRNKDAELENTIKLLEEDINKLKAKKLNGNEIMGLEGTAAKIYFKQIFKNCYWKGRQPRVKMDSINLLLDIGYTLLFNFIEAIVNIYGFDIYKGILHKEFYKRKSLICDMIESFRPIIDYEVRKIYNLSQTKDEDFVIINGRYTLSWKENARYMNIFIEEILKYKVSIFQYIQNYYRWFMKDSEIEIFPNAELEEI